MKKTKMMREVEEKFEKELLPLLLEHLNLYGFTGTAEKLGISLSTLDSWTLKLRLALVWKVIP
jgi:hypothetical protein